MFSVYLNFFVRCYFLLKSLKYYITRLSFKVVQESFFISYIFQILHVLLKLILSGDVERLETNLEREHSHITQFTQDILHLNVGKKEVCTVSESGFRL